MPHQLLLQDGILWHKGNVGVNLWRIRRPVLPPSLLVMLLQACHDRSNHQGRDRTLGLMQSRKYWLGMAAAVRGYIAGRSQGDANSTHAVGG